MKKLLFFIAIFYITTNSNAQTSNPVIGSYTHDVDSMFQNLNKTGITTGILYDRVFPFANLPFFNLNTSLPDTVDLTFFIQGCSELKRAAYTPNNTLPPVADYFYTIKKQVAETKKVNLSVFSYDYNYIDTNSLANGLLFVNSTDSLFYDVAGRPYSPYILKQTSVVSPLASELDYLNGPFTFTFNDSNYYRNHNKIISKLTINFNDGGGDRIFNPSGSTYNPAYSGDGTKVCKSTILFTDGSSSTNYFTIEVKNVVMQYRIGFPEPDFEKSFLATRGFIGYDETVTRYAQANIGIYYADQTIGTTKTIKKPILITDGIDFTQETRIKELYTDYLIYKNVNNVSKSLIDELNLKGYDVIIVDYDNVKDQSVLIPGKALFKQPGADYVERNAMVVVDIIQWANAELSSQGIAEKLVVVGPSMGGLVTRYALRWMETNGLSHNCRLWVSFDAPHRGANIPIGSQYTLEFFAVYGENEAAKKSVTEKLDAPAAKEFLIHHYAANSVAQAGAPNFRNRFNTDIENLGWPNASGLRRVSLVNGSLSGILTNIPEAKSLEVEGKPSKLIGKVLAFLFRAGNQRVLGTESYFTSNNSFGGRVFYGYVYGAFKNIYYTKVASSPAGSCSIDNSPGGIYDTQKQIADQIPSEVTSKGFKIGLKILTQVDTHSFIPTRSALGSYNYTNWCDNLYTRNLVCANEIPFDNYYGPVGSSEPHVTLTYQNVQWIFNELDGTPQAPPADYNAIYPIQVLSGTEPICNSTTYKVNDLPVGSSVSWSVSPSNIAAVNPTGTVTKTGNGQITLTATITNICGAPIIVNRPNITVGAFLPLSGTYNSPTNSNEIMMTFSKFDLFSYNAACIAFVTNISAPGATNVQWSGPTGGDVYWLQSGDNVFCSFTEVGQTIVLTLSVTNSCGTTTKNYRFKCTTTTTCGIQPLRIVIAPNPAKTNMNISLVQNNTTAAQQSFQKIRIIDKMGSIKQNNQFNAGTKSVSVNVSLLTPDVYTIQVFDGSTWYSEKFIKN